MSPVSSAAARIACAFPQGELFSMVVGVDDRTRIIETCRQCGTTVGVSARTGAFVALRCRAGHFLRWLPRPRRER